MTVIAMMHDGPNLAWACDSLITGGNLISSSIAKKVVNVKAGGRQVLMGGSGQFSATDTAQQWLLDNFAEVTVKHLDSRAIAIAISHGILEATKDFPGVKMSNGFIDCSFLLAIQDGMAWKLYAIDEDCHPIAVDTCYWSIGSGGRFALGAMHVSRRLGDDILGNVLDAVSAACDFTTNCGGEIVSGRVFLGGGNA